MPGGAIGFRTTAVDNTPDESRYLEVALDAVANPALIRNGTNVLAVEVHQYSQWSSDMSFDAELAGEPAPAPTPPPSGRPHVDSWMMYYGHWDAAKIALGAAIPAGDHTSALGAATRAAVAAIQAGVDPANPEDDVLVLCYVSVGEDLRGDFLTNEQIRADPRFRGDGTGPRIDPRGVGADGASLAGIDARGAPSNGGTGFASYYLDDNDVHNSANHVGDGFPDRNRIFNSMFVNAGDPAWFDVVDAMTIDSADRVPGLREC